MDDMKIALVAARVDFAPQALFRIKLIIGSNTGAFPEF